LALLQQTPARRLQNQVLVGSGVLGLAGLLRRKVF
jgi:hypothetical protein